MEHSRDQPVAALHLLCCLLAYTLDSRQQKVWCLRVFGPRSCHLQLHIGLSVWAVSWSSQVLAPSHRSALACKEIANAELCRAPWKSLIPVRLSTCNLQHLLQSRQLWVWIEIHRRVFAWSWLEVDLYLVGIKVINEMPVDNVFHYFAADGRERFWSIVLCQGVLPFLKYSSNVCDEPVPWELSTLKWFLENIGEYRGIFIGCLSKHLWR